MAAPSPNGSATINAQNVVTRVAAMSGRTPNFGSLKRGDHSVPVKKSAMPTLPKNSIVGTRRATTMPTVVSTDRNAHIASTPLMASSP